MFSLKDETNTSIHLVPSIDSRIVLVPTKYPQGREKEMENGREILIL